MSGGAEFHFFEAPKTISRMFRLAIGLLTSLSPDLHALAVLPMDDPRRLDFDLLPKPDRTGIPLRVLNGHQRTLAHALLKSALSMRAYTQVLQVMMLENALREIEADSPTRPGVAAGDFRNPELYYFTFFGRPGLEETWGWRVIGHHLSLNCTIIRQQYLSVTPFVIGAEPASVGVLRPLATEEDVAFQLLGALTDNLRQSAIIHNVAPADFATRWVSRVGKIELPEYIDLGIPSYRISDEDRALLKFERDKPKGIAASGLDLERQKMLFDLIYLYLDRAPEELAKKQRERVAKDSLNNIYFGWAGSDRPGAPHYYRVQTSDFLVEFVNSIDSGNHIHSVLRDLRYDLGHGLLQEQHRLDQIAPHHLIRRLTPTVAAEG